MLPNHHRPLRRQRVSCILCSSSHCCGRRRMTASNLFGDGLKLIFAYLDNHSWIESTRVSPGWFRVANSCKQRQLKQSVSVTPTPITIDRSEGRQGMLNFSPRPTPTPNPTVLSSWSLRSHLTHLHFKSINWNDLPTLLPTSACSPSLFTISIEDGSLGFAYNMSTSIKWPPRLTDLQMSLTAMTVDEHGEDVEDVSSQHLQRVLNTLTSSPHLQTLRINTTRLPLSEVRDTIDYSPLTSLSELLNLVIDCGENMNFASSLFRAVGTMPSLTSLTVTRSRPSSLRLFHSEYLESCARDLESLIKPKLRFLALPGFHLAEPILKAIHKVQPNIEELRDTHGEIDIMRATQLFRHLRTFALHHQRNFELDIKGKNYENGRATIDALISCTTLTRLEFRHWHPHDQHAGRLFSSLPHLCQLKLSDPQPLRSFLDQVNNSHDICMAAIRLTHLDVSGKVLRLNFLHLIGRCCLSLTHLRLHETSSVVNQLELFQCFDDFTFLPHLRSISVTVYPPKDAIRIKYDMEKGINDSGYFHDKKWRRAKIRMNRKKKQQQVKSKRESPAPRLVGIEPNPGPLSLSGSHASTPSASNLFDDGLKSIFAFLDNQSWIDSARVSRRWFRLANSCKQRKLMWKPITREPSKMSLSNALGWFKGNFEQSASLSPWSLRSHLTHLHFDSVRWNELPTFLLASTPSPALFTLSIGQGELDIAKKMTSSIEWPSTLTDLQMSVTGISMHPRGHMSVNGSSDHLQRVLNTLTSCPHLKTLRINITSRQFFPFDNDDPIDYSALTSLNELHTLVIDVGENINRASTLFRALGTMPTLTSLTVTMPRIHELVLDEAYFRRCARDLESLVKPKLRFLTLLGLHLAPPILESLALVQPKIEVLIDTGGEIDIILATKLFRHLRTFVLHQQRNFELVGGDDGRAAVDALIKCKTLTRLEFHQWHPHLYANRLFSSLPHLAELLLTDSQPLHHFLEKVNESSDYRVTTLRLTHLDVSGEVLQMDFLRLLGRCCTSLTYLRLHDTSAPSLKSGYELFQIFDNSSFLPQLRSLSLTCISLQDVIQIRYYIHQGINHARYWHDRKWKRAQIRMNQKQQKQFQSQTEPPAPRLVGIEPNPGPLSLSGSHASTPSASNLFDDGLKSIFAFLDNQSWIDSARVSRRWFRLANSCKQRKLMWKPITREPSKMSLSNALGWFKGNFEQSASLSPWSLRSHLTHLHFDSVRWNELPTFLLASTPSPALFTLSIGQGELDIAKKMTSSIEWPSTLTDLQMSVTGISMHPRGHMSVNGSSDHLQRVLNTLTSCPRLKTLRITTTSSRYAPIDNGNPIDYSALTSLNDLHTLIIDGGENINRAATLFCALGTMSSLTSLTVVMDRMHRSISDEAYIQSCARIFELFVVPKLRILNLPGLHLAPPILESLARSQPKIEEIRDAGGRSTSYS